MTDDERAIRDLVTTWMKASQAGDVQTVLSLMADDVIFMVPGHEPFGKEAFAAMSKGMEGVHMEGSSAARPRNRHHVIANAQRRARQAALLVTENECERFVAMPDSRQRLAGIQRRSDHTVRLAQRLHGLGE